jgi:hypothetical protein
VVKVRRYGGGEGKEVGRQRKTRYHFHCRQTLN